MGNVLKSIKKHAYPVAEEAAIIAFDEVLLSLVRVSLLIADGYPVFSAKLRTCKYLVVRNGSSSVCDQLERGRVVF